MKTRMQKLYDYYHTEHQGPRPRSVKYPFFRPLIITLREQYKKRSTRLYRTYAKGYNEKNYPYCVYRHQSVLRRRLGDSDPHLQEQKIINLQRAACDLNNIIIPHGTYFSLSQVIGKPTYKKGYVDGMLLSNGKVVEGVGGGLCQLSNGLCWLMLHADMKIIERYHHSRDVFPDSGRVLPFGSGATFVYQLRDLIFYNTGQDLQLKVRVTDRHLKMELRSQELEPLSYTVYEQDHIFAQDKKGERYRYNQIYRQCKNNTVEPEFLFENFAPVLYSVDESQLQQQGQQIFYLTS